MMMVMTFMVERWRGTVKHPFNTATTSKQTKPSFCAHCTFMCLEWWESFDEKEVSYTLQHEWIMVTAIIRLVDTKVIYILQP